MLARRRLRRERRVRLALHQQLRRRLRQGRAQARARASATSIVSASAATRCACGSIRDKLAEPRRSPPATWSRRCASRTCRSRPAASATRRQRRVRRTRSASAPTGGCATRSEFEDIIVKAGAGGALVRLSDVGRAELGAESYASQLRFQGLDAVGFGVFAAARRANALDVDRARSRRARAAVAARSRRA